MSNNFLRLKILFTIFILVLADQIIKNAALAFLVIPQRINDLLSWEIYKNYGIAFGLPISSNLFYFAAIIFLLFIFVGWKKRVWGNWRELGREKIFAASLIIAGALGNIIDRVKFGYIIDYLDIGGMLIFNLADVFITAGVLIFLSNYFLNPGFIRKSHKKTIYAILFTVLGIIISFLVHAVIEIWYIGLLISDFGKYGFGLAWPFWYFIHSVLTILLFVTGAAFGYTQGKYWWRILYESNKIIL